MRKEHDSPEWVQLDRDILLPEEALDVTSRVAPEGFVMPNLSASSPKNSSNTRQSRLDTPRKGLGSPMKE